MNTANAETRMFVCGHDTVLSTIWLGEDGMIHCYYPALVVTERMSNGVLGFVLKPWAPTELLAAPIVTIVPEHLTQLMTPSAELVAFYMAWSTIEDQHAKEFEEAYKKQISKLTAYYMDKFKSDKANTASTGLNTINPEEIERLFDGNPDWGNPTISH